jgi:hypothetical protein
MTTLNVGNIDRALRLIVGIVLLLLTETGKIGAWGYVGLIPLLTGAIGLCPLYRLLGIRTTSR